MVTGAIIVVAVRARMQVSRSFPRQEEGPRTGGNRQGEHPLHVPRHGDEGPLTLDIFEPTQQELAEAHHRFDDPEHRLRDLLALAACRTHEIDGQILKQMESTSAFAATKFFLAGNLDS